MAEKKSKLKILVAAIMALAFPMLVLGQAVDLSFNPSKIIDDKVFPDIQTFGGAEGIQKFLVAKNSILADTSASFLVKLKEPSSVSLKQSLEDPQPNLGRLRTAAELIWDASKQSGLNPQVLIVTLNKEQGLITSANNYSPEKLQTALDHALGFACPDSGGCGDLFPGFYYQFFGNFDSAGNRYLGAAKSLMKSFGYADGRGPLQNGQVSHVGDTIILDNTLGGFENVLPQQTVMLSNRATAALYRYTPHVFNGNYNFWRFFNAWFKYPNGTLLKLSGALDTYIIQNGVKQLVPVFVAAARGLDLTQAIIVSPTEFDGYQTDKILGPIDNTIVSVVGETQKYVFLGDVKHPASDFVIKQRGLDSGKTLSVTPAESALFASGPVLTPKDGTIIRGTVNPAVYLVSNGNLQLFSAFTFGQQKITKKQITIVSDSEVATYPKLGFVPPLENTLIKSADQPTVYLVSNGLKQPITAEIFKNRGLNFRSVVTLSKDEVAALPVGNFATPKDRSYFAVSDNNQQYIYKEGAKHAISKFVAKQRGITADFKVSSDLAIQWLEGIPIAPRDGSIIKGDQDPTIYIVVSSQLRPLTYKAFLNRRIKASQINTLPQVEVDSYAKGDTLEK